MPVKSGAKRAAGAKGGKKTAEEAVVKEEPKMEDLDGEEEEEDESEGDSDEEEAPPPPKKGKTPVAAKDKAAAAPANAGRGARGAAARNMVFDKGTYIFRLSDLNLDPVKDCVWRVDNHQLLQRYNPESDEKTGGATRKYTRTQNYTGWMCQEGWDYIKLEVTGMYRNMGKEENVTVRYPTDKQIEDAKAHQAQKHKEQQEQDS